MTKAVTNGKNPTVFVFFNLIQKCITCLFLLKIFFQCKLYTIGVKDKYSKHLWLAERFRFFGLKFSLFFTGYKRLIESNFVMAWQSIRQCPKKNALRLALPIVQVLPGNFFGYAVYYLF